MSRDRYLSIMKFLLFSEVKEVKKNSPNTRLDTFCDMLTSIAMHNVDAGEFCAVDEALVLWKGRLGFRQFIKTKRARFGRVARSVKRFKANKLFKKAKTRFICTKYE